MLQFCRIIDNINVASKGLIRILPDMENGKMSQHSTAQRRFTFERLENRDLLAIIISEFVANNSGGSDWVELYNTGGNGNVSLWKISDGTADFVIPPNTTIPALQYQRFDVQPSVSLSKNEPLAAQDSIILKNSSGVVVDDILSYPEQVADVSYGLVPGTEGGVEQYKYFETPTPNVRNGYVTSVTPSGIYTQSFTPTVVDADAANTSIRYTIDGSLPTAQTPSAPLPVITTSRVFRFAVIKDNQVVESGLRTYLFREDLIATADAANGAGNLTEPQKVDLRAAFNAIPTMIVTVVGNSGYVDIPPVAEGNGVSNTVELIENGASKFQYTSYIKGHGNTCNQIPGVPTLPAKLCYRLTFDKVSNGPNDPTRTGVEALPYSLFPPSAYSAAGFKPGTFLFFAADNNSATRAELNNATIPSAVIQSFAQNNMPLGPNAKATVLLTGQLWKISNNAQSYIIRRDTAENLNAYSAVGFNDATPDDLVLRSGNQDSLFRDSPQGTPPSWGTYIKDVIGRETLRAMDGFVVHQRPVNLFIVQDIPGNTNTGFLARYEGLYHVSERITDDYLASYRGDRDSDYFLVRNENALEGGLSGNTPDAFTAWTQFFDQIVSTNLQPNGGENFVQPGLFSAVDAQVHIDRFIDFVLVNQLTKHVEFNGGLNWFASRHVTAGSKWQFHLWDLENWVKGVPGLNDQNVVVAVNSNQLVNGKVPLSNMHPLYLHSLLMKTAAYRSRVEARLIANLSRGQVGAPNPMSLAGLFKRVNTAVAEIPEIAVKGEALRYSLVSNTDPSTYEHWVTGVNDLKVRLPFWNRSDLILDYTQLIEGLFDADFTNDNRINDLDINAFIMAFDSGTATVAQHDVDEDGDVDINDLVELIHFYIGTFIGDSNLDGIFNSTDIATVFNSGEYQDGQFEDQILAEMAKWNNSTWIEGDWNGDREFTSADFVFAMLYGGYDPS